MKILTLTAVAAMLALGNLAASACEKKAPNSTPVETGSKVLKPKA